MAANETQHEQERWWNRLSRGLVVDLATILAVLYTIGLLVVNLDLGRYNVVAIDLARPEYVMVGLLWAVLITFTIFVILSGLWLVRDAMQADSFLGLIGRTQRLGIVIGLFGMMFLLYVAVLKIVGGAEVNFVLDPRILSILGGLMAQSFLLLGIVGLPLFSIRP